MALNLSSSVLMGVYLWPHMQHAEKINLFWNFCQLPVSSNADPSLLMLSRSKSLWLSLSLLLSLSPVLLTTRSTPCLLQHLLDQTHYSCSHPDLLNFYLDYVNYLQVSGDLVPEMPFTTLWLGSWLFQTVDLITFKMEITQTPTCLENTDWET